LNNKGKIKKRKNKDNENKDKTNSFNKETEIYPTLIKALITILSIILITALEMDLPTALVMHQTIS
jgi:hypothetical protein